MRCPQEGIWDLVALHTWVDDCGEVAPCCLGFARSCGGHIYGSSGTRSHHGILLDNLGIVIWVWVLGFQGVGIPWGRWMEDMDDIDCAEILAKGMHNVGNRVEALSWDSLL